MRMGGGQSIFDKIGPEDLIMAFFPCIYFCSASQMNISFESINNRNLPVMKKAEVVLERSKNREYFFGLAVKMFAVALDRGLRLVMENPWSQQTFLKANFIYPPTFVDMNRTIRGDFFIKPTAYWFLNCEPTCGFSEQRRLEHKVVFKSKRSAKAGLCSEERSLISPDYARNFICDFLIGKEQTLTQLNLFGNE